MLGNMKPPSNINTLAADVKGLVGVVNLLSDKRGKELLNELDKRIKDCIEAYETVAKAKEIDALRKTIQAREEESRSIVESANIESDNVITNAKNWERESKKILDVNNKKLAESNKAFEQFVLDSEADLVEKERLILEREAALIIAEESLTERSMEVSLTEAKYKEWLNAVGKATIVN